MDDQTLRAELESLAKRASELHESATAMSASTRLVALAEVKGILYAIHQIGKDCEPPLEVVSDRGKYVVRVKKPKDELNAETLTRGMTSLVKQGHLKL